MSAGAEKAIELGALLELLHSGDAPFTTVQATFRIWRHDERAMAAFHADIEEQKRRGAAISTFGLAGDSSAPPEREELLRIWRSGDRVREQREGGPRDGFYGVRVGELWWMWDQHNGAASNEDDPAVGSGVGQELSVMLDPTPLLGALRFRVVGRSQQAGRATITAEAVPRPFDPRRAPRAFELHELGTGATVHSRSTQNSACYSRPRRSGTASRSIRSPPLRSRSTNRSPTSGSSSNHPSAKKSGPSDTDRGRNTSR